MGWRMAPDLARSRKRKWCVSANPPPRSGNSGVGILRSDGVVNADLSVLRNFPLKGEDRRVQFRAEFFDLSNHPNFGVPAASSEPPDLVSSVRAGPERRIQFGLRMVF